MGKNKGRRAGHERFQISRRNAPGENDERAIVSFFDAALSLKKSPSLEQARHKISHARKNS